MAQGSRTTARATTRDPRRGGWPGGWRLHGPVLALLALGAGIGLVLWGRWGFLVAFDAIRTYCF